jgi:hypothetical protein
MSHVIESWHALAVLLSVLVSETRWLVSVLKGAYTPWAVKAAEGRRGGKTICRSQASTITCLLGAPEKAFNAP